MLLLLKKLQLVQLPLIQQLLETVPLMQPSRQLQIQQLI